MERRCISRDWFPYSANYRRDGYDFDALWDDEKASMRQKKIMALLAGENKDTELHSFEVKQNAGFGKGGEKNFEGTVADLEMRMYLCISDFRQRKNKRGENYGWSIAVYSTPEHLWGYDYVTSAYSDDNVTIKTAITLELLEKYGAGTWSFERIKKFGVYAVRGPRNMPKELKREMEK